MILETKEGIHQWLKKQCPVYVQIVNDDLDGLADYVLKRTIGKGGNFCRFNAFVARAYDD